MSNLLSDRLVINSGTATETVRAEREYFINTARTVTVTVTNYSACYVNFAVQRTNASDTFAYWQGYLNNNYNEGHHYATNIRVGTYNTLTLTFSKNNSGEYYWAMNSSGSGATWTMFLWGFDGNVPSISTS
tara:strand:+ start:157 stop:549 length:393 start_codon:yes stop_codon:yes gene_type:complete